MNRRQKLIAASAGVTLALSAWTAWHDANQPGVVAESAARPMKNAAARFAAYSPTATLTPGLRTGIQVGIQTGKVNAPVLERDPVLEAEKDPFRPVSFVPPPPKIAEAPPPKPTAPPFPYRYFGRMADVEGKLVTYLTNGKELVPVHEKDVLGGVYRVESMSDTQIVVMYIPLAEKTIITIQSAAN